MTGDTACSCMHVCAGQTSEQTSEPCEAARSPRLLGRRPHATFCRPPPAAACQPTHDCMRMTCLPLPGQLTAPPLPPPAPRSGRRSPSGGRTFQTPPPQTWRPLGRGATVSRREAGGNQSVGALLGRPGGSRHKLGGRAVPAQMQMGQGEGLNCRRHARHASVGPSDCRRRCHTPDRAAPVQCVASAVGRLQRALNSISCPPAWCTP